MSEFTKETITDYARDVANWLTEQVVPSFEGIKNGLQGIDLSGLGASMQPAETGQAVSANINTPTPETDRGNAIG